MYLAKIRRLLSVLFIPLAISLSIPLSGLGTQIVNAATISTSSSPSDQALSYWYYSAIEKCFQYANTNITGLGAKATSLNTNHNDVAAGKLFTDNTSWAGFVFNPIDVVYGYYPQSVLSGLGTDGSTTCGENSSQLVTNALTLWNLKAIDLVCGIGYKIISAGATASCTGSGGDFTTPDLSTLATAFTNYITKTVYGGLSPSNLSQSAAYSFYSQTLINGCTSGSGSTTKPVGASSSTYFGLYQSTDSSGNPVITYYNAAPNLTSSSYVYTQAYDPNGTQCGTLLSLANSTFTTYANDQACRNSSTFANNTALVNACIAGFLNKDITYCAKTYPNGFIGSADHGSTVDNSDLRQACYAGQGNGGADGCIAAGYTSTYTLTACINGSNHSTDPNYCLTVTPLVSQTACLAGQKITSYQLDYSGISANNCSTNPTANGCAGANTTTSCNISGLGWIVCPVVGALAGVDSLVYSWIESVLTLNPITINDPTTNQPSAMYQNWQIIRNFANVLLVIIFLIVIFSQLTSLGISNYGVKKMLPRIIMIAIAINLSYFIMSLLVDVVNIAGKGLYDLFSSMAQGVNQPLDPVGIATSILAGTAGAGVIAAGGVGVAAVTATSLPALGLLLLPFLLGAVLALFAALATLFIRNALVILLVIVSPLALAAYLLPNTSDWFTKWRKLFTSMLIMFPFAAVLFGGAQFTAYVILGSNPNNPIYEIMAIFIIAAPLGALPFLARSSGGIVGNIGNRLQGLAKSARQRTQKGLQPYVDNRREGYRSGSRNIFGRKQNTSRRTFAQRLDQRNKTLLANTEVSKTKSENDWIERGSGIAGGPGGNKSAQAIREVLDAKSDNKLTGEQLHAEEELRSHERIKNNAQSSVGGDGLLEIHERKEAAEFNTQAIKSEFESDLESRKQRGGDLFNTNVSDRTNKAQLDTYKKQTDQLFKEAATESDAPHLNDIDAGSRRILQDAQLNARVADSATASADRVLQQEYASEILQGGPTATDAAGISAPSGVPLVEAQAYETQRKAYDANVAAYSVRLSEQGIPDRSDDPAVETLTTISQNASRPLEEREAAGRAIVSKGNIEAIQPYQDYLTTSLETALDNQRNGVPGADQDVRDIQALQKAFGSTIGSSPGKPMGLGAADIAAFQTGTYVRPTPSVKSGQVIAGNLSATELQTINTVAEKGVSMDNWAVMDKTDIKLITSLAQRGLISDSRKADLIKTIQTSLSDVRWSGRIKEREKELLGELEATLSTP